jgi:uncharacterized protein (TIGR00369 family)
MDNQQFLEAFRRRSPPPIALLLGARAIAFDIAAGRAEIEFDGRADFANGFGSLQGGILTAMLDNAMTSAALAVSNMKIMVPTLEIKTSFIAPAMPGRIIGIAEVLRMGRSVAFLSGRLADAEGTLVATASATCRVVAPPPEENTP